MDKVFFVNIFTDGSCIGNPGKGGYAAIIRTGSYEKVVKGYAPETTNNQMELKAIIEGLKALTKPCEVLIFTDSQYVADAFNKGWLEKWQKINWVTTKKQPVKNKELWVELLDLLDKQISYQFFWLKGHADNKYNNKADEIARNEALSH